MEKRDERFKNFDKEKDLYFLREAIKVSEKAKEHGNCPFGAILVDAEGNILMEGENTELTDHNCIGHAETPLASRASKKYEKDFLWGCTLYSSCEPCPMCAGAIYWSNVGRVMYAMSEAALLELTGNHPQNPTMTTTAKEIFDGGQKGIVLVGPVKEVEEEALAVHRGYWNS